MPRSYLIFKWAVYALATLLLALLQLFVLDCVSVGGDRALPAAHGGGRRRLL